MVAPWMREGPMPTLEERVAYLEGRLGDHFAAVDDLRVTYREFRADANRQFGEVRSEVEHLRDEMSRQFGDVSRQFGEVRGEARRLEDHVHQQFRWIVGVQVTSLIAVGSAVVGLYFK
jgi:hypothetical protein